MSDPNQNNGTGGIPSFPFQEVSSAAGNGTQAGGRPDFEGLRSALDAAVRALRSFQDFVGVLERQQWSAPRPADGGVRGDQGLGGIWASGGPAAGTVPGPAVPPREVFPLGRWEAGGTRAALSRTHQAQLDEALARAFANETAPDAGATPTGAGADERSHVVAPPPVLSADEDAVFALAEPDRHPSPFGSGAVPAAPSTPSGAPSPAPQPTPAPPALMAAAPPLPPHFLPFTPPQDQPVAFQAEANPAPLPAPAVIVSEPAPPPVEPLAPPVFACVPGVSQLTEPEALTPHSAAPVSRAATVSLASEADRLPFSPFQGLDPVPPPPHTETPVLIPVAPEPAPAPEPAWPSSPFFGATQASTAPFRVVEPPPVILSTTGPAENTRTLPPPPVPHSQSDSPDPVLPSAPSFPPPAPPPAPAAASAASAGDRPAIPSEGQVFNFAELLRANGQR